LKLPGLYSHIPVALLVNLFFLVSTFLFLLKKSKQVFAAATEDIPTAQTAFWHIIAKEY
jgi:hypothetical protein